MANKIAILGSIYTLLTEFKIMNDDEFLKFYEKNPIISVKNNLTIEDLKKGNVYHTVGYQSIPNEIKSKIEQSTFSGFCNKYSDLLNIYWVPYGNASFGGYANRDKNTIVIVYESPQGKQRKPSMNSIELSTEIIVHELKHKVDMLELREYSASHPDHKFPFFYVPSLITERNAYLTGLWLCDEFPAKTPEIIKRKKILKELLAKANLLLGLPEDNEDYLHPPYEGIDLHSVALQIDPATISWLPLKVVKTILNTLDKLGYNQEEKKWLFERCMLIAAGKPIDLGYVKAGRRDLLVDFLGKLIGVEKTKTGGFLTLGFLEVFTNIKKNIKDPSGKTIVSLHLLLALLGHHLKKQESKK